MSDELKEMESLVRARVPILFVRTAEEHRFLQWLTQTLVRHGNTSRDPEILSWSHLQGLQSNKGHLEISDLGVKSPSVAITGFKELVRSHARRDLPMALVLFDPFGSDPRAGLSPDEHTRMCRAIRESAFDLRKSRSMVVCVSPSLTVPETIKSDVRSCEFPLPSREILDQLVVAPFIQTMEKRLGTEESSRFVDEMKGDVLRALSGLTVMEARDLLRYALEESRGIGSEFVQSLVREKSRKLASSVPGLTLPAIESRGFEVLAGYTGFKEWATRVRTSFTPKARLAGVQAAKGVLLAGPPGTGKSFTAQVLAGEWRFPLLRLSLDEVKQSYVGETESNFRRALGVARALSPCILQVDEADKALSGTSGDRSRNDLMMGLLSSLLIWQQEQEGVFMFYTANTLDLPPALLRRGRLDRAFLAPPPSLNERKQAFSVYLQSRNMEATVDPDALEQLAMSCAGFSYAEIEGAVNDAFLDALVEDRSVTCQDLIRSAQRAAGGTPDADHDQVERNRLLEHGRSLGLRSVSESV